MKADQVKVIEHPVFSELDMWVHKIIYCMIDYKDESKEVQLNQIEASLVGVGVSKYIKEQVRNLVIQRLRL